MHIDLDGGFCFSEAPWLSWGEIKCGLDRGYLSPAGVVEYSLKRLSAESSADHYELACLAGDEVSNIRGCVIRLAAKDLRDDRGLEKVWVFLIFLWVFINRDKYQDPLGVVEEMYADFDYPESVAPIVRYMPAADPSLEGEDQLLRNWSNILDSYRRELEGGRS